jgi:hypothetical protein
MRFTYGRGCVGEIRFNVEPEPFPVINGGESLSEAATRFAWTLCGVADAMASAGDDIASAG